MKFCLNFTKILSATLLLSAVGSCSWKDKADFSPSKTSKNIARNIEFVEGTEDVQLQPDLIKINDESLNFDTTAGSISSLAYESKVDLGEVKEFYLKTMPQIGWKIIYNGKKKLIFLREKQKLEIEFSNSKQQKVVKFFLSSLI